MSGEKRVIVGGQAYVIDDGDGRFVDEIVGQIKNVLTNGGLAEVPVLDGAGNRMTLLLRGGDTGPVIVDLGLGPRPNEMSP